MYFNARRYVNSIIVERLISRSSRHYKWCKIITIDWLALDNVIFKILDIIHTCFIAANVYYELFNKLIEGLSYLKNFKVLIVEDPTLVKVVKMPVLLSPANKFCGHFFEFVKFLSYFKTTQAPSLSLYSYVPYSGCLGFVKRPFSLIKIKEPR